MADRRRRRRRLSDTESECSEDEIQPKTNPPDKERQPQESECPSCGKVPEVTFIVGSESEGGTNRPPAPDTSEVGNTEDDEEDDDDEDDDDEDEDDEDDDETTEYEDSVIIEDGWIETERQSGDGEEQPDKTPEKDLDDDEDKKNPAYIPRRGAFYEHDTRNFEENAEDKRPKKKLWKDDGKWDHDRYKPELQGPKSRDELIAAYGYDIRQSDRPPDMPRRSDKPRQGRGRRSLLDFMDPDKKDLLDTYGGHRRSNTEPDSNKGQGDKSCYNEPEDFPVLNRTTMMYERPNMNNKNQEYDNRRGNNSDYNNQEHNRYGRQGQQRSPRESYPERSSRGRGGGRGGERGGRGMDRGGRNNSERGGRGGSRGGRGRGGYTSYSDLRGRSERNERFDQDERVDYQEQQNRPDRMEKNLSRNDRNQDRYEENNERVDRSNQRYDRPSDRYTGRGDRYDGPQRGPPGGSRQWNNSNYKPNQRENAPSGGPPRDNNRPRPPTPEKQVIGDTIIISNSNRKSERLADIPPEIMPPVTTANPSAFSPPVVSSSVQHPAERKSYSRERERRGKPAAAFTTAGKPTAQGPIPRTTDAPGKFVTSPIGVTAGSGRMAGAGQVGTGPPSAPITTTTSAGSMVTTPHAEVSNRNAGYSKPDQNRPKRYSSQRQRNVPDPGYQEAPVSEGPVAPHVAGPRPQGQAAPRVPGPRTAGPRPAGPHVGGPRPSGPHPNPQRPPAPHQPGSHTTAPTRGTAPRAATSSVGSAHAPPFYPAAMYAANVPPPGAAVFRAATTSQEHSPPHTGATFPQTTLIQQPVAYAMPLPAAAAAVSQPLQNPPRMYNPATPATMANPQPIMQATYMAAPIVSYATPAAPPGGPYPLPGHVPIQGFAPAPQPLPPQPQPQPDVVHVKGGTTYFNPDLQQPSPSRSPARRPKAAIPIVNPQDLEERKRNTILEEEEDEYLDQENYPDQGETYYTDEGSSEGYVEEGYEVPSFTPTEHTQVPVADTELHPEPDLGQDTQQELESQPVADLIPETLQEVQLEESADLGLEMQQEVKFQPDVDLELKMQQEVALEPNVDLVPETQHQVKSDQSVDLVPETQQEVTSEPSVELVPETQEVTSEPSVDLAPKTQQAVWSEPSVELVLETQEVTSEPSVDLVPETQQEVTSEPSVDLVPETPQEVTSESSVDLVPETPQEVKSEPSVDLVPETQQEVKSEPSVDLVPETQQEVTSEPSVDLVPETQQEVTSEPSVDLVPETQQEVKSEPSVDLVPETQQEVKSEPSVELVPETQQEVKSEPSVYLVPETQQEVKSEPSVDLVPETQEEVASEPSVALELEASHEASVEPEVDCASAPVVESEHESVLEVLEPESMQVTDSEVCEVVRSEPVVGLGQAVEVDNCELSPSLEPNTEDEEDGAALEPCPTEEPVSTVESASEEPANEERVPCSTESPSLENGIDDTAVVDPISDDVVIVGEPSNVEVTASSDVTDTAQIILEPSNDLPQEVVETAPRLATEAESHEQSEHPSHEPADHGTDQQSDGEATKTAEPAQSEVQVVTMDIEPAEFKVETQQHVEWRLVDSPIRETGPEMEGTAEVPSSNTELKKDELQTGQDTEHEAMSPDA